MLIAIRIPPGEAMSEKMYPEIKPSLNDVHNVICGLEWSKRNSFLIDCLVKQARLLNSQHGGTTHLQCLTF